MSMKKWTDEELNSTRDKLGAWSQRHSGSKWGARLWLFTAFLGAFAISTGFAFIFFDGITALSIFLIILGSITCFSWYKSDKQRKDNIAFLAEINKEFEQRKKREKKAKIEKDTKEKPNKAKPIEQPEETEESKSKNDVGKES